MTVMSGSTGSDEHVPPEAPHGRMLDSEKVKNARCVNAIDHAKPDQLVRSVNAGTNGLTAKDRFQQTKANPSILIERHASKAFASLV